MKAKKASVPKKDQATYSILNTDTPWEVKEAYKTLRTNVTLSLPDEGHRIIAFTSAEPHDGKTTNAINFAISLAQINKKVLLVDCDLRKPMVAITLDIPSEPGLSDMISGQERAKNGICHINELGIDVIPSGTNTPDPTLLLQSNRMKMIMHELKKIYEYIIVDLPPATVVSDASILADIMDGFLLVVRHNTTDHRSISDMMEQLKMANAKIIGFVYNGIGNEDDRYYNNNYGYKKYGYGYYRQ